MQGIEQGTVLFAADYPFLDVLWSMLIFMAFVLWIWLAISCFIDIFRRRDTGGFVKALWVIALIVLPYLGVLIYLIVNHRGIAERRAQEIQQAQQAFDERVREVAATAGPAAEIEKDAGTAQVRRHRPGRVRAPQGKSSRPQGKSAQELIRSEAHWSLQSIFANVLS